MTLIQIILLGFAPTLFTLMILLGVADCVGGFRNLKNH